MKSPYDSILTEAERKIVRHWTIFAGVAYGTVAVGLLALVVTHNGSYTDAENPLDNISFYDIDGIASPVLQPGRLSQPQSSKASDSTNALAPVEAESVSAAAPAVSIPEANELAASPPPQGPETLVENGYDFTAPNGVPGFGPLPQPESTPSASGRQLTAHKDR